MRSVALLVEGVGRNQAVPTHIHSILNVALLVEGVGRNPAHRPVAGRLPVALLVEGVGRNDADSEDFLTESVALLVEGVGRNPLAPICLTETIRRPPRGGRG